MRTQRLKTVARAVIVKGSPGTRPAIGLEHVEPGTGRLLPGRITTAEAGESLAFEADDVLFGKLRPYLAKSIHVTEPVFTSAEFLGLRTSGDLLPRFLFYVTLSQPWLGWAVATSFGAKMPRTSWDAMGEFRITVPEIGEQQRIADFLDDQVALFDRAIQLREHQRSLLDDRQWAGLLTDVESARAASVPLRRVLTFLTDGPFGSAFTSADYVSDGAFVVRLGNIGFGEFRRGEDAFIPEDVWSRFPRCHVQRGDLLIAGLGDVNNHAGRACLAPDLGKALVKGKCYCARVDERLASATYLALMLSSPLGAERMELESRGSTRAMINLDIVKSVVLPIPERTEQERIVSAALARRAAHLNTTALLERELSLFSERRKALVTAAITGAFDVTTARSVA